MLYVTISLLKVLMMDHCLTELFQKSFLFGTAGDELQKERCKFGYHVFLKFLF